MYEVYIALPSGERTWILPRDQAVAMLFRWMPHVWRCGLRKV